MRSARAPAALSISKPLGTALVAGGATALLWLAARRFGRDRADQILDWDQVTSIALRACAAQPPMRAEERERVEADYSQILREISEPLGAYTGTSLELADSEVRVLDRTEWIHANVRNFRDLLQPLEDLYREAAGRSRVDLPGLTAVGRLALSAEVGALLGYLARRVLGQYDISLLGARPIRPGKLYFVEPNVRAAQLRLGLPRHEFRMWLALHEATHAHEFEGHPWVREYMNSTLQRYLQSLIGEIHSGDGSVRALLARVLDRWWVGGTLMEAVMTPEQRELFSRLQALMCLLEGYSSHVMSALGRRLLPHFVVIDRRVEERSMHKSAAETLFLRLTGLQMKLDQYRLGEAFVNQVSTERGAAFMSQVWEGPQKLPTEQEIREPTRWMARMEQAT